MYVFCPQTCQSKVFDLSDGVSQYAWFPCQEAQGVSWYPQYWLKVIFFFNIIIIVFDVMGDFNFKYDS